MPVKVLILGGTSLARQLTEALTKLGFEVVLSLAGVTSHPHLPQGLHELRLGGFGGGEGLARYIAEAKISVVVDATHPFAVTMGQQVYEVTQSLGVACFRLAEPPWQEQPGDRWHRVKGFSEAAALLPLKAKVFLSIGHKGLGYFFDRPDVSGVIRLIEPLAEPLPHSLASRWQVIFERGPFTVDSEISLFRQQHISHLVSKNSGSVETAAKLAAARFLGLAVVVIERPQRPDIPDYNLVEMIAKVQQIANS